jgi:RNA polymerase sigma-70 factor (ECF subfamily)
VDEVTRREDDDAPVTASRSAERVRALVRTHFGFVWRSALRLGLPEDAADDAAQQVFIVLARRIEDVEEGAEKAFLYRTTTHVVAELRRSHARRIARVRAGDDEELADARDPDPGPDEALEQKRARAMLASILEKLDDDVRQVFVLFELEHLPVPEIARLLDLPEGTASSRLRRGREQFQKIAERMRARAEHARVTASKSEGREP